MDITLQAIGHWSHVVQLYNSYLPFMNQWREFSMHVFCTPSPINLYTICKFTEKNVSLPFHHLYIY